MKRSPGGNSTKVGTILLLLFLTVCVIEYANRYFTAVIHSGQITELFQAAKPCLKKACVSGRMILFGFTALFLFCLAAQTPPDFFKDKCRRLKKYGSRTHASGLELLFSAKERRARLSAS